MKRLMMALGLILALSLTALAGCNSGESGTTESTTPATSGTSGS